MTTTNKGKPTKSELGLITEMFVRAEIRRVRELNATHMATDGNNPRLQARELALQRVLDFIIMNKRS
jgi:hypothetical protein